MSRNIAGSQLAVFAGCGLATLVLGLLDAGAWLSMREYGLFQNVQAGVLGLALGLSLLSLWRAEGQARVFWVFVLGFAFFFVWRELDLDQEFFADRMFSWAYLFRDSVPLSTKLILGLPSIGLSLAWGGYVVWRAPLLAAGLRHSGRGASLVWAGLTLACFGLGQIWDKATAFQRDWGIRIYDRATKDPYVEEAFELLGAVAFVLLIVELRRTGPER